jgi:hypothetical protein
MPEYTFFLKKEMICRPWQMPPHINIFCLELEVE